MHAHAHAHSPQVLLRARLIVKRRERLPPGHPDGGCRCCGCSTRATAVHNDAQGQGDDMRRSMSTFNCLVGALENKLHVDGTELDLYKVGGNLRNKLRNPPNLLVLKTAVSSECPSKTLFSRCASKRISVVAFSLRPWRSLTTPIPPIDGKPAARMRTGAARPRYVFTHSSRHLSSAGCCSTLVTARR